MSDDKAIANVADAAAASAVIAIWMSWLPVAAAIVTIVYTVWRFVSSLDYRRQRKQFPFAPFGSQGIETKHPHKDGESE